MVKIKFDEKIFTLVPSSDDDKIAFVFNKEDGSIFQVENVTKEVFLRLIEKDMDEECLLKDFANRYDMNKDDLKNFKKFLSETKKEGVVKEI